MGPIPGKVQNGWRLFQNGVWTSGPTLLLLAGYPYPGEAQLLTIVVLQEGRATLAYNGHGEIDELWNRPLRMRLITDYLEAIWEEDDSLPVYAKIWSATDGSVRTVSAEPGGLSDRDGTTRTAGFEEAAAVLYSKRVNLLVFDVLGREFV